MKYPDPSLWRSLRCPGFTNAAGEIALLVERLPKRWAIYSYKQHESLLWVVFMGGTGTGKSTLFNGLCGEMLSETGIERPKTFGPIAYLHRDAGIEERFPFDSIKIERLDPDTSLASPHAGGPGRLLVLEHTREELSHLALVDLPDLDSVEVENRRVVEDLYLMSDLVIFVTSQEKYADEVPFQFLERVHHEGKPFFLLLNKAGPLLTPGELLSTVRGQGINLSESQFRMLPYFPSDPGPRLSRDASFRDFTATLFRMSAKNKVRDLVRKERSRAAGELTHEIQRLIDLLGQEEEAARRWREHLDMLFRSACHDLFEEQEKHFAEESREYLQNEIRRLYGKYDLLGKPRRFIAQLILAPLRFLGLGAARPPESHDATVLRIRQRFDVTPILAAVAGLNRAVLEDASPADGTSPFFKKLRDKDLMLTDDQVKQLVLAEQDRLVLWLEQKFQALEKGIPKAKQWSIYSTSILWGGLILSLEVAIGGGISVLEAVLDSAMAPFVTKGAVELFAYHEIQGIARELAARYREGLVSVVSLQRDRYAECLDLLMTSRETLASLRAMKPSV
jgi:hypothetical protein